MVDYMWIYWDLWETLGIYVDSFWADWDHPKWEMIFLGVRPWLKDCTPVFWFARHASTHHDTSLILGRSRNTMKYNQHIYENNSSTQHVNGTTPIWGLTCQAPRSAPSCNGKVLTSFCVKLGGKSERITAMSAWPLAYIKEDQDDESTWR